MDSYSLTPSERTRIFLEYILPDYLGRAVSAENPIGYILGGQPGSGKSHLLRVLYSEIQNVVIINGDDMRGYHPQYSALLEIDESTASDKVQPDCNYWVEALIEYCLDQKYSIMVEGTMRTHTVPIKTSELLAKSGYTVVACVVACHPRLSWASAKERYIAQKEHIGFGRETPIRAHDESVAGIPITLQKLSESGTVHRIRLFKRSLTDISEFEIDPQRSVVEQYYELRDAQLGQSELEFIEQYDN